jgi:hypothetical protein
MCYGLARTLSGSGVCLVCRLTDLSRPGEDYGMEGRCRRIGGSPRTEPDRLAYIIARQPGPRWSSFLFSFMFSFLRFTAPRSSSSAIQLVQQLNLVRLLTSAFYPRCESQLGYRVKERKELVRGRHERSWKSNLD